GGVGPVDARGRYPNFIFPNMTSGSPTATMDRVFRTMEETGLVLGMHTFPAMIPEGGLALRDAVPGIHMVSPGDLVGRAGQGHVGGRMVDVQTMSFIYEAAVWLAQVLLSGMLDLYPRLRIAIFEANSSWLPQLLAYWERPFRSCGNE